MRISIDGTDPITLAEFFKANDGFDAAEQAAIAKELELSGEYRGGGGAAAEFKLKRVVGSIPLALNIPTSTIANLMISALESGDPVTSAAKGGWCYGLYYRSKDTEPPKGELWYANPDFYDDPDFQIEVWEVSDESKYRHRAGDKANIASGALTVHTIRREQLIAGLGAMCAKFGGIFSDILTDNTDATTADVFLQCVVFGEERYG